MIFGVTAGIFAMFSAVSISKGWRRLEFAAKPAVIVCLIGWLYAATGLRNGALCFGLGLLFSLIGDLFLLQPARFFIHGLAAFVLAHVAYIVGFNTPPSPISAWSILLAAVIGVSAARLLRRILRAMREQGQRKLLLPVAIYSAVITLMLVSALMKLSDTNWAADAALLVGFGAAAFYFSDLVLGWNKFVSPISEGHLLNMVLYHLGQIMLIAGVIAQRS